MDTVALGDLSGQLKPAAVAAPVWPKAIGAAAGAKLHADVTSSGSDAAGAASVLFALRLSFAAGLADTQWIHFAERRLAMTVQALCSADAEFSADAHAYFSEEAKGGGKPRPELIKWETPSSALQHLRFLGALDALYFALWALGRRQRKKIKHPAELAVEAAAARLKAHPAGAESIRGLLRPRAVRQAATSWGLRKPWLSGKSRKEGGPWRPGACKLLEVLRSRWCEAVCVVAPAGLHAGDPKVRRALHAWQAVGRDCGARWLAFVPPSAAALAAIAGKGGQQASVAELGAGNGYWAGLLAKAGATVTALDADPPPEHQQHPSAKVQLGTAENLPQHGHDTLLLCMPPPGESGCCEEALAQFPGSRVAYVGEWGSGMTGTQRFHQQLFREFDLERRVPLPCWPKLRAELFLMRRRGGAPGKRPRDEEPAWRPLSCDVCGGPRRLRRCPWSRQLVVCSEECYEGAEEMHRAVLALCFCGAAVRERPALDAWEKCHWLDFDTASSKQWDALRDATPQSEHPP